MLSPKLKLWLRRRLRVSRVTRDVLVSVAVTLVGLYVTIATSLGVYVEPQVMDLWFRVRGRIAPPKDVVVIAVDEESHSKLDVSSLAPWPRALMAKLLERVANFKPKGIILDFSYSEKLDPEIDARLARAFGLSPTYIATLEREVERVRPDGVLEKKLVPIEPNEILKNGAKGVFDASISLDFGVVRRFTVTNTGEGGLALSQAIGAQSSEKPLPTSTDYINYYGPPGSIVTVGFHEILNGTDEFLASALSGKYILIGQKLMLDYRAQQTDTFFMPYGRAMAGVEVHATVLGNLLDGSWITGLIDKQSQDQQISYKMLMVMAITFFVTYSLFYLRPLQGIWLVLGTIVGWTGASYYSFTHGVFLPGAITVFLILPLTYIFFAVRVHLRTRELEKAIGLKK